MSGAILPLPQSAFMAWCLVKKSTGTTLPLPYIHTYTYIHTYIHTYYTPIHTTHFHSVFGRPGKIPKSRIPEYVSGSENPKSWSAKHPENYRVVRRAMRAAASPYTNRHSHLFTCKVPIATNSCSHFSGGFSL
jgi:hypothetical protein